MRASCKGILKLADLHLPINIYLAFDIYNVSGQLFHKGCNGKIKQPRLCEDHLEDPAPEVYSALVLDNQLIEFPKALKDSLFGRDTKTFDVIGCFNLTRLKDLLGHSLVPCGFYEVTATPNDQGLKTLHMHEFETLITRLRVRKQFLLIKIPLAGMLRYCILIANQGAHIFPLLYSEEIRPIIEAPNNLIHSAKINKLLDSLANTEWPELSLNEIDQRIQQFVNANIRAVISV